MILNEQAAELLNRCERIVGCELKQIRGNLFRPETRSSAVWELLVLEAFSEIGIVEYEPISGGSPDIRMTLPGKRALWIEAAFLHPRFWKQERQTSAVTNWLFSEADKQGVGAHKILPIFRGLPQNNAGYLRQLPRLNEKTKFLKSQEIIGFFNTIRDNPDKPLHFNSSEFTLSISYNPNSLPGYRKSEGLAQEAPTDVKEHAVYRVLKAKAKQHSIEGPKIICIGSDQSPSLSKMNSPLVITCRDAIEIFFKRNHSISAVIVVEISYNHIVFQGLKKQANCEIFLNKNCNTLLTHREIDLISKINFNKWKYSSHLKNWKNENMEKFSRVTGTITYRPRTMGVTIEIPANVVVDALAGKTTLSQSLGQEAYNRVGKPIEEGWVVESCSFKQGQIEKGEAPKIILELCPPLKAYEK